MGIAIYYAARRTAGLTDQEREVVEAVVRRYSVAGAIEEYHRTGSGWNGEDFCLYEPPFDSPDTILEGATRLPDQDEDVFWAAVRHWCEALSQFRRLLPDAEWNVHVDDLDIVWDAEQQAFDPAREPPAQQAGERRGE
jgi:hypothetical protein